MNYIALTIGPIYKTLKNAKKTREIWGASYFFSYIMKKIIENIKEKEEKIEFIAPFVKEDNKSDNDDKKVTIGVGLYHDRLIVQSDNFSKKDLDEIIDEVLKDVAKDSNDKISYDFLENYLQIHTIEIAKEKIQNPILDISPYLDTAELFFKAQKNEKNQILEFVKRLNGTFLAKDAFNSKKIKFPSLPQIALNSVDENIIEKEFESSDDEQEVMSNLIKNKDYKNLIKPYNKYICIVQADGDNIGTVLKQIGKDNKKLSKFSEALFNFCIDATKEVDDFKGRMIFAGGDDLLFFAPVVSNNDTIFHLCERLSEIFEENIDDSIKDLKLESKPSLSFGVSITYYKYPLYEARENAVNLLFSKAKVGEKNAIAYKVTKHSGQSFEAVVYKSNTELFNKFLQVIQLDDNMDENFLHSIYTKIYQYKTILENILTNENYENKLKNFFKNYFNKSEHKKYEDFFKNLVDFFVLVNSDKSIKNKIDFVYASLRFKKFLLGDKI